MKFLIFVAALVVPITVEGNERELELWKMIHDVGAATTPHEVNVALVNHRSRCVEDHIMSLCMRMYFFYNTGDQASMLNTMEELHAYVDNDFCFPGQPKRRIVIRKGE